MPALDDILAQKLHGLDRRQARRALADTRRQGVRVWRNGKPLISFSCNDYLGLSQHPKVIAAAQTALGLYGAGAGASRLVTGNHPFYAGLEGLLARTKGTQACLVFSSGYGANLGIIPALVGHGDLILADRLAHASLLDAAKLSDAALLRFAHNDMAHLAQLLTARRGEFRHCLIVSETVFSMDGDRAPLDELKSLATGHDAWLMSDDAHGFGVLPFALNPADVQMGTLSKAVGSGGGYVCGSQVLIDYIATAARSLIYSTGLPPATVAAAVAAVEIIEGEPELVARPLALARYFTSLLGLAEAQSAVVPWVLHDNEKTLAASRALEDCGFLVTAIRPPTVPPGSARLRFAFSALHTQMQINALADAIKECGLLCVV